MKKEIEKQAIALRKRLGLEKVRFLDPMTVITKLREIYPKFAYARVPDKLLPRDLAFFDPETMVMSVRESVFCSANWGLHKVDGRARMTIFHEIGHLVLEHKFVRRRSVLIRTDERLAPVLRGMSEKQRNLHQPLWHP
jgi:hypothetical protein